MSGPGPTRLEDVLATVLATHGVEEQIARMDAVERWPEIAGDPIARVTRARGLDDDTLIVEVRNSAWLMELNMMKGEFLARVNEHLDGARIERLVFVQAETE